MRMASVLLLVTALGYSGLANATETITYTYDAKGRIVQVTHSGTVNNGTTTVYTHDTADNRTEVKTTGAPH